MLQSPVYNIAYISFNVIRESKIIAIFFEFTDLNKAIGIINFANPSLNPLMRW